MKKLIYLLIGISLSSCGVSKKIHTENIEIQFLDEYVLDTLQTNFENTRIGGLSGIDYHQGDFYLVCDDASNPRIYKAAIDIQGNTIEDMSFSEVIKIEKPKDKFLDLEGIRRLENGNFIVTSEGLIDDKKDPGIYIVSPQGRLIEDFKIPSHFTAEGEQHPRNNGVFEGVSTSFDGNGYWVATEAVLKEDGSKSKIFPTKSPIRLTK